MAINKLNIIFREAAYAKILKEKGSKELADIYTDEEQRWPPPKMTSKTLFDLFYADKIRNDFNKRKAAAEPKVEAQKEGEK